MLNTKNDTALSVDLKIRYNLGGSHLGNSRLNLQYYQLQESFNNELLHPAVVSALQPHRQHDRALRFADVCCGTGAWLIQLSRSPFIHASTELFGFDKSLSALPPSEWCPRLQIYTYDVFEDPALEFQGTFDVVNVSLALSFISDEAFPKVLSNIMKLLIPGTGWLQWTELSSTLSIHSPVSGFNADNSSFKRLTPAIWEMFGVNGTTWNDRYDEVFQTSSELDDIHVHKPDVQWDLVKAWTELVIFPGVEDVMSTFTVTAPDTEENRLKAENFRELCNSAGEEFLRDGTCI